MGGGIEGDFSEFDVAIAQLAKLDESMKRGLARAAPEVQRIAREAYAQNKGPDGGWARNTSNNRFPSLARPAAAVEITASGLSLEGEGEDVLRYHLGAGRGGNPRLPARAVFPPDGELPVEWQDVAEIKIREEVER